MDNKQIDKMFKLKQFIMRIYEPALMPGNNLQDGEYLRILTIKDGIPNDVSFFKNIDDVIDCCINKKMYC